MKVIVILLVFAATLVGALEAFDRLSMTSPTVVPPTISFACGALEGRDCVVRESNGGSVWRFAESARRMLAAHERLVIDGRCASACAYMADLMLSAGEACMTPRGYVLLHEARKLVDGRWYPVDVPYGPMRPYIESHGGLPWAGWLAMRPGEGPVPGCTA